jgi:glucosyl-3-phosphoglycerate synthase
MKLRRHRRSPTQPLAGDMVRTRQSRGIFGGTVVLQRDPAERKLCSRPKRRSFAGQSASGARPAIRGERKLIMSKDFNYSQFLPISRLVEQKKGRQTTISLIIPAANEAPSIGSIVNAVRHELVESHPLLDEIIVIDGNSTDATVEIARTAKATVFAADEILPQLRLPPGKGSSLYKSQAVTSSDIAIFIDADIVNFDCRFIYGLAGPLLMDDTLFFSKAYYKRPLIINGTPIEHFGGRVTEIMLRPLLSLFYPEIARLYQPLSGEYAFRRNVLNAIPFSTGYGVELELLLEMWKRFGLDRLAQVDMGIRCHRNRPVEELGQMSFAIVQVLLKKLQQEKVVSINMPISNRMISHGDAGWYETVVQEQSIPPFNSLALVNHPRDAKG